MPHEFLDHTADVAVEVRSGSLDGLFAEALRAFTDTLTPVDGVGGGTGRRVRLEAPDLEELMVLWLEELLFVFEVDSLLFSGAEVTVEQGPAGSVLAAALHGEHYDPERHPLKVLIKGVTYHTLAVEEEAPRETGEGWRAHVIFDI